MQLYLCNKETEFILFRPIRVSKRKANERILSHEVALSQFQNSVMSAFIAFLQTVRADFTADEQIIIACPTQEQVG